MNKKMICFDMDGTIADLYGVPNWLEKLHNEDPSPYLEAKPLYDMDRLGEAILDLIERGWEVRIISWLAKDSSEEYKMLVRKAKIEWLEKYNFPYDVCHLVQYNTTKADCIRGKTDFAVLVDDNAKIRRGWSIGDVIDPTKGNLIEQLEELIYIEEE